MPDFYGSNEPDQKMVMVDEDEGGIPFEEVETAKQEKKEPSPKKVDVLNDPLLPEDEYEDDRMSAGGSKDADAPMKLDEDDDDGNGITYDDLEEAEKYEVL